MSRLEPMTFVQQACLASLVALIACNQPLAEETASSDTLRAMLAPGACFATGSPDGARLPPPSNIVALRIRPRDPERDGDGSYPADGSPVHYEADDVPLTLTAAYAGDAVDGPTWGQRFTCSPNDGRFICGVDDWCADVGFDLTIDGPDRLTLEILDDSGPIGILGDSCNDAGRALGDETTPTMIFHLDRRPTAICR